MASINILEDYYIIKTTEFSPTTLNRPLPSGASRFELWYQIQEYTYNPLHQAILSLTFKGDVDTNGLSSHPQFHLYITENTSWQCITFDLPTVNELSWIVANGDFKITWELYVNSTEATVSVDKGLEYDTAGILNVNPSTAEDSGLNTTSKTVTGAINEVFQYAATFQNNLNTFAGSIKQKGGTVASPINASNVNKGILSIPQTGGGGITPPFGADPTQTIWSGFAITTVGVGALYIPVEIRDVVKA